MSSFYCTLDSLSANKAANIAQDLSFSQRHWTWTHLENKFSAIITRNDDSIWSPAFDEEHKIFILIGGRVALDPSTLDNIVLDQTNRSGAIAKHLLDRYIIEGTKFIATLNGAFAILVWDATKQILTIATDRLGVFPVYAYKADSVHNLQLCTHPDVLAKYATNGCTWDMGTFAMALGMSGGVFPYTYYNEVRLLAPGSIYQWSLLDQRASSFTYWNPAYTPVSNLQLLSDELSEALTSAIRRRTHPAMGATGVFLSGGTDSRICLFAQENPSAATTFTLFDQENFETATAQALSHRAGARYISLQRDLDYYPRIAPEALRIGAGQWNFWDAHYHGFDHEIAMENIGTILTGCYADYMFKGLLQNRQQISIFGTKTPIYKLAKPDLKYYLHQRKIADPWHKVVHERMLEQLGSHSALHEDEESRLAVELMRLRPLSCEPDYLSRSLLWKMQPWDHYLSDLDVLNAYLKVPLQHKINGDAYGRASAYICQSARDIPNANSRARVDANKWFKLANFILFKIRSSTSAAFNDNPPQVGFATDGSWSNFSYIIRKSPALKELWNEIDSEQKDLITEILGKSPWNSSLNEWSGDMMLFCRIFSLAIWHKFRIK